MTDLKDFQFTGNEEKDAARLIKKGYDTEKAFRAAMIFASKFKGNLPNKKKVTSND